MKIELKRIHLENFKKVKEQTIDFSLLTKILGKNASGKSTIVDAFMWCLFDKNSAGGSKFQIRPLDCFGNQIDHVEIKVEVTLSVGGREIVLSKTQKQNWTKKRGSLTETMQGNVNSFEIDGIPKKEKDYKEFVNGIVNEDLFKLLTNPQAFVGKQWKEQRNELMKLLPQIDNDSVIAKKPEMLSELNLALSLHSPEDLMAKSKKALLEYKKKQTEIPARIDEVRKSISDIDVAELELQKNTLNEQIAEIEKSEDDMSEQYKKFQEDTDSLMGLKFNLSDMERQANEGNIKEQNRVETSLDSKTIEINKCNSQIRLLENEISDLAEAISVYEKKREELLANWNVVSTELYINDMKFDEESTVCPSCGQNYPIDKITSIKADFEKRKLAHKEKWEKNHAEQLDKIISDGNTYKKLITEGKEKKETTENDLADLKKTVDNLTQGKTALEEELAKIPVKVDISNSEDYRKLSSEIAEKEKLLAQVNSGAEMRQQLRIKKNGLKEELSIVERKITSADNTAAENRIEELTAEMTDVAQKVADEEKMIYLLEEFTKAKMTMISQMVNESFDIVDWKLFDTQINGAVVECCECTVNGVPYSVLNTGHRIVAGLDIIKALSKLHGVSAPIFIDNAEAVNDFNIPEMDSQIILLSVSDDTEIRVDGNRKRG